MFVFDKFIQSLWAIPSPLYNPNVSTINLVFVNTNQETITNFITIPF